MNLLLEHQQAIVQQHGDLQDLVYPLNARGININALDCKQIDF